MKPLVCRWKIHKKETFFFYCLWLMLIRWHRIKIAQEWIKNINWTLQSNIKKGDEGRKHGKWAACDVCGFSICLHNYKLQRTKRFVATFSTLEWIFSTPLSHTEIFLRALYYSITRRSLTFWIFFFAFVFPSTRTPRISFNTVMSAEGWKKRNLI